MAERRKEKNKEGRGKTAQKNTSGKSSRRHGKKDASRQPRTRKSYRFAWLYGLISGIIMVIAVVAACLIFFQVENVTVEGSEKYSSEEIIEASGIEEGQNMFFIRRTAIEEELTQSLPYLKTVSIHLTLPGTVRIEVTDCEPVAVLVVTNGYWFIDEEGKLLELRSSDGGLPNVTGLSLETPTTGTEFSVDAAYKLKKTSLVDLLTALKEQDLLDGVVSIDLSEGSEVLMQYTEKYTVKIPYGSDFDYKMRAMNGIIESLAEENDEESGVIDLTLDDEWHFIPD